nr:hypothetical protein [Bradyrhizobium murdochi]
MHADYIGRPACCFCEYVYFECRGVCRNDCPGLAHLPQTRTDVFLDLQVLEYSFDDQIAARQDGIIQRSAQQTHPFLDLLAAQLAVRRASLVILADKQ